jgi:adenine-specific DNA-methyltransferase
MPRTLYHRMDYSTKTRNELLAICKETGLKGYSTKKKSELIELLSQQPQRPRNEVIVVQPTPAEQQTEDDKICRLNYIGSKFQLLDWITEYMKERTGWTSFSGKTVADLFAGTGVVSYHFRREGAQVISNDAELYSSIITWAFTRSVYTDTCRNLLTSLQAELDDSKHTDTVGFVTTHYTPHNGNERKFFTVENGKRIDYIRARLEEIRPTISEDEYKFLLASLILRADAVSNVPAVYGCFLQNFKAKALKNMTLEPIHKLTVSPLEGSTVLHADVLTGDFPKADLVYLDPPYNNRQYSKNYFPLNIIAKTPSALESEAPLGGKTGIPADCFSSPFCKKESVVANAFDTLFRRLDTKWVFVSYNSESTLSKDTMIHIMQRYGTVSVIEREYKRFKSYEYNKDLDIKEYLFCLEKRA